MIWKERVVDISKVPAFDWRDEANLRETSVTTRESNPNILRIKLENVTVTPIFSLSPQ
jgi:hypothetical protein